MKRTDWPFSLNNYTFLKNLRNPKKQYQPKQVDENIDTFKSIKIRYELNFF